jgi:hypothetical protein
MLRLRHNIEIEQQNLKDAGGNVVKVRNKKFVFPYIHQITVDKSYDVQTQLAEIILPRNLNMDSGVNLYAGDNPMIMRGDKVKIEAGYYPNIETIFEGYVARVGSDIPTTIKCEDEMFILKQDISPNVTLPETATLKQVLERCEISTKYDVESINAGLGKFRVKQATKAWVLQSLRNIYGIFSFFIGRKLYVGLASWGRGREATFLFERQMISHTLNYLRAEDVRIQIKGVLIKSDNSRIEKNYGDLLNGDLRTVFQWGGTEKDLDLTCNRFLQQAQYTGYHGSFETFLEPQVEPGDHAVIRSYKYPDRDGTYLIKSVKKIVGVKGGRQTIELERKLSDNSKPTETQI